MCVWVGEGLHLILHVVGLVPVALGVKQHLARVNGVQETPRALELWVFLVVRVKVLMEPAPSMRSEYSGLQMCHFLDPTICACQDAVIIMSQWLNMEAFLLPAAQARREPLQHTTTEALKRQPTQQHHVPVCGVAEAVLESL